MRPLKTNPRLVSMSGCVQGTDEQKAQGRTVLVEVMEALRIVAVLLSPVTPTLSKAIYQQLGYSDKKSEKLKLEDTNWGGEP